MMELFCYLFLFAFLIFYSLLVIAMLGQEVRRVLRRRVKRARRGRTPEPIQVLPLSPQTQRN